MPIGKYQALKRMS